MLHFIINNCELLNKIKGYEYKQSLQTREEYPF